MVNKLVTLHLSTFCEPFDALRWQHDDVVGIHVFSGVVNSMKKLHQ